MRVVQVEKGRTMKRVVLTDTTGETDEQVLDAALDAARETPSSLFGWVIDRDKARGVAVVTLHTD